MAQQKGMKRALKVQARLRKRTARRKESNIRGVERAQELAEKEATAAKAGSKK